MERIHRLSKKGTKSMNKMDYNNIIELDNVTMHDCEDMYRMKNMRTVINDGRVVNFEKEEE